MEAEQMTTWTQALMPVHVTGIGGGKAIPERDGFGLAVAASVYASGGRLPERPMTSIRVARLPCVQGC